MKFIIIIISLECFNVGSAASAVLGKVTSFLSRKRNASAADLDSPKAAADYSREDIEELLERYISEKVFENRAHLESANSKSFPYFYGQEIVQTEWDPQSKYKELLQESAVVLDQEMKRVDAPRFLPIAHVIMAINDLVGQGMANTELLGVDVAKVWEFFPTDVVKTMASLIGKYSVLAEKGRQDVITEAFVIVEAISIYQGERDFQTVLKEISKLVLREHLLTVSFILARGALNQFTKDLIKNGFKKTDKLKGSITETLAIISSLDPEQATDRNTMVGGRPAVLEAPLSDGDKHNIINRLEVFNGFTKYSPPAPTEATITTDKATGKKTLKVTK